MKLSESEWLVMKAIWQCQPATAREVIAHLPADVDWAYTTVKTMLARLVIKKAVSEQKRGNLSLYEAIVTAKNARRNAFKSFLNQAFDGAVEPMLHFLVKEQNLTPAERRELAQLLSEEEKGDRRGS